MENIQDLYTDYLLSSFRQVAWTNLETVIITFSSLAYLDVSKLQEELILSLMTVQSAPCNGSPGEDLFTWVYGVFDKNPTFHFKASSH
jgi:hypothetical protein